MSSPDGATPIFWLHLCTEGGSPSPCHPAGLLLLLQVPPLRDYLLQPKDISNGAPLSGSHRHKLVSLQVWRWEDRTDVSLLCFGDADWIWVRVSLWSSQGNCCRGGSGGRKFEHKHRETPGIRTSFCWQRLDGRTQNEEVKIIQLFVASSSRLLTSGPALKLHMKLVSSFSEGPTVTLFLP